MALDNEPQDEPLDDDVAVDAVEEVRLGDALARDHILSSALVEIAQEVESKAPGNGGWATVEFLKRSWLDYVQPIIRASGKAIAVAVKRFSDVEVRKILARSQAKINTATADKISAEAEAIRAAEERRDKLLEYILAQDIDMAAEERDGLLRVVFVKPDDETASDRD
jgi:hypothetical protein